MHKTIVNFLACFIMGKANRRAFRQKHGYPQARQEEASIRDDEPVFAEFAENCAESAENRFDDARNKNRIILVEAEGHERDLLQPPAGLELIVRESKSCTIRIHASAVFTNCRFELHHSENILIDIQEKAELRGLIVFSWEGHGASLSWGKKSTCFGVSIYLNEPGACVRVGEDCMFSGFINIWPTDGHAILDAETGKVLNGISHPVEIGNHCWIGQNVTLLKNAVVPDNCVVAHSSLVAKKFEIPGCILAGNPARVVKDNITWHRQCAAIYNGESE